MIRGPSGGGKTTLLNIIGTIDLASGGTLSSDYFRDNEREYYQRIKRRLSVQASPDQNWFCVSDFQFVGNNDSLRKRGASDEDSG